MTQYHEIDGVTYEFPDDATEEEIMAALSGQPAPAPAPEPAPEEPSFDTGEMASNIIPSAVGVAGDMYQAITNPIDTVRGLGQTLVGGMQHVRDQVPGPLKYMAPFALANLAEATDQDFRPQASAAGQFYKDRYGGVDEILNTLEQDPVGAAADVTGLFGMAAPRVAARFNPFTRGASALMDKAGQTMMGGATKFSTVADPTDIANMNRLMLDERIMPSARGVAKLKAKIKASSAAVDDLINQAEQFGGEIHISQILSRLDDLREQRGGSLVSGADDLRAIDEFGDQIVENARRLNKEYISAADLQRMKRDLYDQIAWNVRRQVDEVPVLEDARKGTARAAKETIEDMVPEVKDVNARLGDYLEMEPHLERAARRISNRSFYGMSDALSLIPGVAGAASGNPSWLLASLGLDLVSNPRFSPHVAYGIYQTGKGVRSPITQGALSVPYWGGELYYAGERGALED